jgi:hypothetical protein
VKVNFPSWDAAGAAMNTAASATSSSDFEGFMA